MFRSNTTTPKSSAAPHFPTYLLPSLKIPFFRRGRQDPTVTTSSAAFNDVPSLSSSPTSTDDDFLPSPAPLVAGNETYTYSLPTTAADGDYYNDDRTAPPPPHHSDRDRLSRVLPDVLRCNTCGTDVAYGLQVVSKGFTGRHGRALLVSAPLASPQPSCPGSPLSTTSTAATAAAATSSFFSPSSSSTAATTTPPGHHALARDGANLVNVAVGRPESRNLVTGAHVVADISCAMCGVKIGWKYVDAREQAQKYKVGKFILETERVVLFRSWEDARGGEDEVGGGGSGGDRHFYSSSAPVAGSCGGGRKRRSCSSEGAGGADGFVVEEEAQSGESESEEEIVFDSDDEDECEDIFSGVWDAATVARRRGSKVSGASRQKAKKGR